MGQEFGQDLAMLLGRQGTRRHLLGAGALGAGSLLAATLAGRGTAIGDAIALATKRLQQQANPQKVLILLTDGVNTAGTLEPQKAAQIAKDKGDHRCQNLR